MLDSSIVLTSILDPPVRTLLLQRTPVKVERCGEEEDEVRSALGRITRTERGALSKEERPLLSPNFLLTLLLIVGRTWLEDRRQRRLGRSSITAQTRASLRRGQQGRRVHLCTRPCWRGHLWRTQEKADARIFLDARMTWRVHLCMHA